MGKILNIQPLSRIEGHASIEIRLDDSGNVEDAITHFSSIRGFEKYVEGKPAEEVTRIVTRICGICPWHHHLASTKAVDACYKAEVAPTGHLLRECMQNMAHINDKILHFYFLAAPDFVMGPDADYSVRNVIGIAQAAPDLARRVIRMRQLAQMMMERFAGKVIHPIASVPGGFSKPMDESQRQSLIKDSEELLEFAKFSMDYAKNDIFPRYMEEVTTLGTITSGFIGTVDDDGVLNFYEGKLRLMKPDGSYVDFEDTDYLPEEILWRYKVQYTQGAGCESLGERLAEQEMSEEEYQRIKAENPKATINSREAAYYFKIFRGFHPQDSILGSIGIWTGFDFAEERERVRGTVDGNLKHDHGEDASEAGQGDLHPEADRPHATDI